MGSLSEQQRKHKTLIHDDDYDNNDKWLRLYRRAQVFICEHI